MKILRSILLVVLSVIIVSSVTSGANRDNKEVNLSKQAVDNFMAGIRSENIGLKLSAAFYLGEYGCDEAVIELLRMLKSDDREEVRITAALALYKINDARGMYAVKQAIRFDDSDRVKKICGNLYREHLKPEVVDTLNIAAR
jgi:hypothetical protein